jgi:hypothetical protein
MNRHAPRPPVNAHRPPSVPSVNSMSRTPAYYYVSFILLVQILAYASRKKLRLFLCVYAHLQLESVGQTECIMASLIEADSQDQTRK